MDSRLRSVLLGGDETAIERSTLGGLAVLVFLVSFGAYALGFFSVAGGLVWIPGDAALLGMLAGAWVGYHRLGIVFAWIVTYASLLGYLAESAFFEISPRRLVDRVAAFLRPDGLVFLGVEALILGTLAFVVGYLVGFGIEMWTGRKARSGGTN